LSSRKPKVYVTRRIPEKGLQLLREYVELDVHEGELPPPRDVLIDHARDKDGLLSLLTDRIDSEVMASCPSLRAISNYAVGFDNIDVEAATKRGIIVTNTPGVLTETVADFAWALLMASARRVVEADRFTRAGRWKTWGPTLLCGADVFGKTLGIVGAGRIGSSVARRASGFRMRLLYTDVDRKVDFERETGAKFVSLDELLSESDFVSLHVSLTAETRHMIGERELKKMKRTAILVNTSRGPVVDEEALCRALESKVIAGAALDVFEEEPIPASSPLLRLDNVVVAPHIASASIETREKMAVIAARNLLDALSGREPEFVVNPEVLLSRKG
jgi:glyoxylate reductase